jgi:LacI family transcriptional regulator
MKNQTKRLAVIGLPMLQAVDNADSAAIAVYSAIKRNWRFIFCAEETVEAFRFLQTVDYDGAIVRITRPAVRREALKVRFPLVNISDWLEDPGVPTVRHDSRELGRLTARHLLDKGFRRFGCVIVPGGSFIQKRNEAFAEEVRLRGIDTSLFHLQIDAEISVPKRICLQEQERFKAWVQTLNPPAALVLMDDWDAPTLMKAVLESGREIPSDLAVVAASIHMEVLPHCPVPLSSAQADNKTQMKMAMEMLEQLMEGRPLAQPIVEVPPLGVVERASTATQAIEDREVAHAVAFIRAHRNEVINVSDVEKHVQLPHASFYRRFFQVMGRTPREHLVEQRVQHVQELLFSKPRLSLKQVAQACGFPTRARMNLVFKRQVGLNPSAWRQASRSQHK